MMKMPVYHFIRKNAYILIPILCILFWAFISVLKDNFYIYNAADFDMLYNASKNIFTNPQNVYTVPGGERYPYTPFLATIFGMIVFFFSFEASAWILFIILYIAAIGTVIEFNKILNLYGINKKSYLFIYLLILSNGILFVRLFDVLQTKIIVSALLLLFLRREIEMRNKEKIQNDLKFKFTQVMILCIAIGLVPHYALFLLIIYFFQDIRFKELLHKEQIQKVFLFILAFVIQNFMGIAIFILSPNFLGDFFTGMSEHGSRIFTNSITHQDILSWDFVPHVDALSLFFHIINFYIDLTFFNTSLLMIISISSMLMLTVFLIYNYNLEIEKKFGYIALTSLFMNIFYNNRDLVILLPLILILFIKNIDQNKTFSQVIKEDFIWIIGLLMISILYFVPPLIFFLEHFKIFLSIPLVILFFMMPTIYLLLLTSLLLLKRNSDFQFYD